MSVDRATGTPDNLGAQRTHNPDNIPILHVLLFSPVYIADSLLLSSPVYFVADAATSPTAAHASPRPALWLRTLPRGSADIIKETLTPTSHFLLLIALFLDPVSRQTIYFQSLLTHKSQKESNLCLLGQSYALLPPEASGHGCETSAE